MTKQFTDHEQAAFKEIGTTWQNVDTVLSVESVNARFTERGKWIIGFILVKRGKISRNLAKDLQELAFSHVPDLEQFTLSMTDSDQLTVVFEWHAGRPWQERAYPYVELPPAPKDEY